MPSLPPLCRFSRAALWAALALIFSGCATVNKMAVDRETKTVDVAEKSILLMTLELSRPEASRYVPHPLVVFMELPNAKTKEERQNFKVDGDAGETDSKTRNLYLIRMAIKPGDYVLQGIFGDANAFPFHGFFFVPLRMKVKVAPNAVTYLGRVNATLRPRVGNEFRAGSLFPLIDQAAAGISGSTFDVEVVDRSEKDIRAMQLNFPALANTTITTSMLPPFDRAEVQRQWENNSDNAKAEKDAASKPAPTIPQQPQPK